MLSLSRKGRKDRPGRSLASCLRLANAIAVRVYGALLAQLYYYHIVEMRRAHVHGTSPPIPITCASPSPMRCHNYYAITAPFGFNQIFVIEERWSRRSGPLLLAAHLRIMRRLYAATHPVMLATALITFPSDNSQLIKFTWEFKIFVYLSFKCK
jgi:hypothetical protein